MERLRRFYGRDLSGDSIVVGGNEVGDVKGGDLLGVFILHALSR